MKTKIEQLTGDTVEKIGEGEYTLAFRSLTDPMIVYLAVREGDNAKDIIRHVDTIHAPIMEYMTDFTYYRRNYGLRDYTLYKTEFTHKPLKKHGRAYDQWKILKDTYDTFQHRYFRLDKDQWYIVVGDFIDHLRDNNLIDESIIDTLDHIDSWASALGPNYKFEFPACNVGVDQKGNLILRDIVFFR